VMEVSRETDHGETSRGLTPHGEKKVEEMKSGGKGREREGNDRRLPFGAERYVIHID